MLKKREHVLLLSGDNHDYDLKHVHLLRAFERLKDDVVLEGKHLIKELCSERDRCDCYSENK